MEEYLNKLNIKQLESCKDTCGPSLIIAGAGSGKTRVLTSRIAYLIEHDNIDPSNILAITFTNKAAKEMSDRVNVLLDYKAKRVTCKTFHSFCAMVLRSDIDKLEGRKRSFQIIDDDDTESLIRDAMVSLDLDPKVIKPKEMASYISLIKANIKDFTEFPEFIKTRLINTYEKYNQLLFENNLLDFDDLLMLTVELFKEHKDILDKYHEQYKYILVDEFQDSSNIQYELVEMLAQKYRNIFIVGDEDQSIYSFRGANIGNIRKFMKSFPEHHKHILDENYRSTGNILDCANSLISHNETRIKKDLWTSLDKGNDVSYIKYYSDREEALGVVNTIKKLVNEGYNYSDFAIIYRNNFLSRNFEDRLLLDRIPYRVYSGLSFYKREEVKDMIAYLRLALDENDFYSFKRCLQRPKRGIGDTTINKIEDLLHTLDGDLTSAIENAVVPPKTRIVLDGFVAMMSSIREDIEKLTLRDFYNTVYEKTGYKKMISELEDEDKKKSKGENIQELLNAIMISYTEGKVRESINDFLETVTLLTELDVDTSNENKVSLITMHSAKGLEYRCVFAVGLEEDIIPGMKFGEDNNIEEERRILYVCLTRAMRDLYISCANTRFKYGQTNITRPSRFIEETGVRVKSTPTFEKKDTVKFNPITERVKKEAPVGEFKVKERVYHEVQKYGTVLAQVDGYYIIKFDDYDTPKKVIFNHPLLKRAE